MRALLSTVVFVLLFVEIAWSLGLTPGTACSSHSSCNSGRCLGGFCCATNLVQCSKCGSSTGICTECSGNYYATAGTCVQKKMVGNACSGDEQCPGTCRVNCCAAGMSALCSSCNSNAGGCVACPTTHYTTSSAPGCILKRTPGQSCTSNFQCKDGLCPSANGRCCLPSMSSQCTSCADHSGVCLACPANLARTSNGAAPGCVAKVGFGVPCSSNSMCQTNVCKVNRCCQVMSGASHCSACDDAGKCKVCTAAYFVSVNGCFAKKGNGAICGANSQCISNLCKGSRCCRHGVTSQSCNQCTNSGSCSVCNSGYYPDGSGLCPNKKGDGNVCGSNVQCITGKCIGGICCKSAVDPTKCTSCQSSGAHCQSCVTSYHVDATTGTCKVNKLDGAACTADAACTSGKCLTHCCSAPQTQYCATCGTSGKCATCVSTRYLNVATCLSKRATGVPCSDHGHPSCTSGKCEQHCCNSGMASQCDKCGTNGQCESCSNTHWVTGGSCSPKIADGEPCTVQHSCVSDRCEGRCCGGTAVNCTACDSGGECSTCVSSHYLNNSKHCREKKGYGEVCANNVECKLPDCRARCCLSGVDLNCLSCSANGTCSACTANYWLDGRVCRTKASRGSGCAENKHCLGGLCAGNICCESSISTACTGCISTAALNTGTCLSCQSTHKLSGGDCVPRRPTGASCITDDDCQSLVCRKGVCCIIGAVTECLSCNSAGWCTSCAAEWYMSGSTCRAKANRTASESSTITPPPTPTESPTMSSSTAVTVSESTTVSGSATASLMHSATSTITATPSSSMSHTVASTATASHKSTATVSESQRVTTSATLLPSETMTAAPTVSLLLSETVTDSSTPSTPISTSVSGSLLELYAELLNGTTVESWVIGREPHSQALKIQLTGERLDPTLFNFNSAPNQTRAIDVTFLANPLAANDTVSSPCTAYVSTHEAMFGSESANATSTPAALAQYLSLNATVLATSERDIEVWFPPSPGFAMERDTELTLWLTRGCLASRRPFMPVNFTLLETPVLKGVPEAVMKTSRTVADVAAVVGGIGSPVVATQLSRSTIVLGLVECSPDEDTLSVSQSPFGLELLDSGVGQYVGGALLNHVASLLFAGILVCIALGVGAKSGKGFRQGFLHGCEVARFPSLLSFSSMLLIEPTAMCCMVVMLYTSTGVKVLGGVSLALLVAMPVATLAYFRPRRGEFVYHPLWDEPRNAALLFFFGRCKWTDRDGPHTSGFCQRNRLFFCDYVGSRWYFLAVEMVMSIVCGAIDGLKLGLGRCNGVAIALFVVLLLYVVLLLIARPYNNAFLLVFAFTLAVLQLVGAGLMMVHLQFGSATAFVAAEWVSVACMWLLSLRMMFDIAPKTYLIYKAVRRAVGGAAAKLGRPLGKSQRFEDMRERVLYAMDDEKAPDLDTAVRAGDAREEALLADLDRLLGASDDDDDFFPSDYENDDVDDDDGPVFCEGGAGLDDYGSGGFGEEMDSIDGVLGVAGGNSADRYVSGLGIEDGGIGGSAEELWSSTVELLGSSLESQGGLSAAQQEQMSQRFKELDGELRRLKIAAADGNVSAQGALDRLPPNNQVLAMLDDGEATMLQHALEAVPGFESQILLTRLKTARSLVAERAAHLKAAAAFGREGSPSYPHRDATIDRSAYRVGNTERTPHPTPSSSEEDLSSSSAADKSGLPIIATDSSSGNDTALSSTSGGSAGDHIVGDENSGTSLEEFPEL